MSEQMNERIRPKTRRVKANGYEAPDASVRNENAEELSTPGGVVAAPPRQVSTPRPAVLERRVPPARTPRMPIWAVGAVALAGIALAPVAVQYLSHRSETPVSAESRTAPAGTPKRPVTQARAQAKAVPVVSVKSLPTRPGTAPRPRRAVSRPARRQVRRAVPDRRVVTSAPIPEAAEPARGRQSAASVEPRRERRRSSRQAEAASPHESVTARRGAPAAGAVPAGMSPAALNAEGHRLQRQGRYAEAEPYLRRAVELRPGYAYAEYNLGETLLRQGKTKDALQHLNRTAASQPERWEPQQRLAEAYERLGQKDRAAAHYARVRQLRAGRRSRRVRRLEPEAAPRDATPERAERPRRSRRPEPEATATEKPALDSPTHVDENSVLREGPAPKYAPVRGDDAPAEEQ